MYRQHGFQDFVLLFCVWLGGVLLYGFQIVWFGAARVGEASLALGRRLVKRPGS